MALWSLALTVLAGCLLGRFYYFGTNYIAAKKTGLRCIISPVTPYTLHWQLAASLLRPQLVKYCWFRAIDWTCAWRDGHLLHARLGSCFIVVSPGLNVLCTDDPVTVEHVLKSWREFVKPDNVNVQRRRLASPPQTCRTKLNLIQTLIKANEPEGDGKTARLSDDELRGNIFIFTAGGLESTSTTISYALALLALHPEVQEWVAEEVEEVVRENGREYRDVFPRLKRCMAVMEMGG
ncbi:p450-domain-containing protein [Decorospora gaudefroyi]|uniref:p450-domain-containing protein n=1 Tax=Decorospora gaudefroyi TaxID=184978 RepID=A0A6A5K231_9PLEO|nr:p450-domain-containing protein [Decorospora gaudefroyi]